MATIDRFQQMLKRGRLVTDEGSITLTAQMKYDFLAAVNTMQSLENLNELIDKRKKKREALREKIMNSCFNALKIFIDDRDKLKDIKSVEAALRVLNECRTEMLKLDSEDHEISKLSKEIPEGVTAGQ